MQILKGNLMKNFQNFYNRFSLLLRDFGLKNSTSKEQILKILYESNEHLSASEIQSKLPRKISLTAIYQFLNFLCNSGLVLSINKNNIKKFELNLKSHHDHLICRKCGNIWNFFDNEIEKRQDEICKKASFLEEGHIMILYGICKNCQNK
jgi:transcriptional regulator, fur family